MFLLRRFSSQKSSAAGGQTRAARNEPTEETTNPAVAAACELTPPEVVTVQPPVRLLLTEEFCKLTDGVPFYEALPQHCYVSVDFNHFLTTACKETAVVSWRWKAPKPRTREEAEECMKDPARNPVPQNLVAFVREKTKDTPATTKYLWLDWCCAPQYPENMAATMQEINRSGSYYTNAATLLVWCFDELKSDSFAYSDYFNRAWTLSERLHRSKSNRPLSGRDVVPHCLATFISAKRSKLALDEAAPPWGVLMAKAMAKLQLSASMNAGGILPEVVGEFVSETVVGRYPLIAAALQAVEGKSGSLTRVLTPPVLAALSIALRLLAISEWTRRPDPVDDMSQVLGFGPKDLKAFIIGVTVQQGRMTLNNYSNGALTGMLEGLIGIGDELRSEEEVNDGDVREYESISKLDKVVEQLWNEALSQRTIEHASQAWLKRYLTKEVATYDAFAPQDKLFAVYKLFDNCPDRVYDQVHLVWSDLCRVAELEFLNSSDSSYFGWLREVSLVGSDEDSGGQLFFAQNTRARLDLPSTDPRNFGVYAFPPTAASSPAVSFETILLHADVAKQTQVVSFLLGFNLCERAAATLGKKTSYTLVNKEMGGEIDTHLSLRGRKALGHFETRLHESIKTSFAFPSSTGEEKTPFITRSNNGLFICVRYHGLNNLSQCLVIRTSSYAEGEWTIESIATFTAEPMKGSSWGVAKALDNLVGDLLRLEHDRPVEFAFKQKGMCEPFSETTQLTCAPSVGHDEFFSWVVGSAGNHARGATTYHDGLLIKKESVDVGDLVVFGKTNFDAKTEFNRMQKASQQIASLGPTNETLSTYYNLLQRNYVHDSVMAEHLDYFGDLCEILVVHLEKLPVLLEDASIRQSFDYFSEDMHDALDIAGENGVREELIAKTREALKRLAAVLEG